MLKDFFSNIRVLIPFLLLGLVLLLADRVWVRAPASPLQQLTFIQQTSAQQANTVPVRLLNGQTASLSWIIGADCQRGMRAYLQSAATNPDAALVGTGWVNPQDGTLIQGQSNTCLRGSLSMDNVIHLIHSHGGKAYLNIAMETDGTPSSWTTAQETDYVARAVANHSLINPILQEVARANYDGVIMDLEGVDHTYPNIQQVFASYNHIVWSAVQPMHKLYGIALIHKLNDHDDYYNLNMFQNWQLLGHAADFIVVMAVDQSYWTPGPTVSVPWLNQLLAYTLRTMPQMLPHIIWELPLYGNSWHWENGGWVFDGDLTYQAALSIVNALTPAQIDASASNLHDTYSPYVVYTDSSGVKHALWYLNGPGLYHIVTGFWQILQQEPRFGPGPMAIGVWWRTSEEPQQFWPLLDTLYKTSSNG